LGVPNIALSIPTISILGRPILGARAMTMLIAGVPTFPDINTARIFIYSSPWLKIQNELGSFNSDSTWFRKLLL